MIDLRILIRALVVGTVLQVIMVSLAHFIPWVMVHVFEFAGMMISATAGYLYAMDSGKGYFPGATAGAIVGGGCALVGTVLSASLGDVGFFYLKRGSSSIRPLGPGHTGAGRFLGRRSPRRATPSLPPRDLNFRCNGPLML